jgi:hypothetical protein
MGFITLPNNKNNKNNKNTTNPMALGIYKDNKAAAILVPN